MKRLCISGGCLVLGLSAAGCLPANPYTDPYEPDASVEEGGGDERDEGASDVDDADDVDDGAQAPSTSNDGDTETPVASTSTPPNASSALPTSSGSQTGPDPTSEPGTDSDDAETDTTDTDEPADDPPGDDPSEPVDQSDDTSEDGTGGAGDEPTSSSMGGAGGSGEGDDTDTSEQSDSDDFFGDSRCSDEFVFCEDFESGELDGEIWQPQGPAPELTDERAARGSRSAHFQTEDNGLSLIRTSVMFPMPNNRYYARAFVYFDSMPTAPEWAHWTVSGAEGSGTEAEIRVGGQYDNTINRFGVGSDRGPTGDWTWLDQDPEGAVVPVPVGEWVCLEWMNDGEAHESRFWWDDVEHESLHTTANDHGGEDVEYLLPEFESVWFGWWLYQANTEPHQFDVWIDEIVIDDEPISCVR